MKNKIKLLFIIFCLFLLLAACRASPGMVKVTSIVDGDTIVIRGGYRVRYIGIDAPETFPDVEAYGLEALEANRELVEGKEVRLEKDVSMTDEYNRLLRYVYVDDIMVNAELVRLGLARAVAYPPDTAYQDYLEEMENEAKSAGRGIWSE